MPAIASAELAVNAAPDPDTLLATARELQRAAGSGALPRPLEGKHLCLLGPTPESEAASAFREGARELGAQVTVLDPGRLKLGTDADVARSARMLGRLYDAVECQGLAADLVRRLRSSAGVPVYDGLALDAHPTAPLSAELDASGAMAEQRRRVLQAVLVAALA